jgi:hypothetical protein
MKVTGFQLSFADRSLVYSVADFLRFVLVAVGVSSTSICPPAFFASLLSVAAP